MKISPALLVALIGAAAVFFYMQRRAQAAPVSAQALAVPQSWIEQTPAGYTVVGTTSDPYDILT